MVSLEALFPLFTYVLKVFSFVTCLPGQALNRDIESSDCDSVEMARKKGVYQLSFSESSLQVYVASCP